MTADNHHSEVCVQDDEKHDSFLKNLDYFALPIAMTYKGKKSHPTNCGGVISIWFISFLLVFLATRFWVLYYKDDDVFFQSKMSYDDPLENFVELNENIVNLEVSYIVSGEGQTNFD